jgi:periplasmic divalent cation tolerance protein
MAAVLVLTTVPDAARGETIARALVDAKLAACVSVGAPMTSIYRWKDAVERETEHQLLIKTTPDRVAAIEARLAELHPYEIAEFLVVPVAHGAAAYLDWLLKETRA